MRVFFLLALTACTGDSPTEAPAADPAAEAAPPSDAPEADAGDFAVVDVAPTDGALAEVLQAECAAAGDRKVYVQLTADWCGPCKELRASLGDERMKDAFAGTHIVRADVDAWGKILDEQGFASGAIPVFHALDAECKAAGRSIHGGAWAENIPANMAPPLKAFFQG